MQFSLEPLLNMTFKNKDDALQMGKENIILSISVFILTKISMTDPPRHWKVAESAEGNLIVHFFQKKSRLL